MEACPVLHHEKKEAVTETSLYCPDVFSHSLPGRSDQWGTFPDSGAVMADMPELHRNRLIWNWEESGFSLSSPF